MILNMNAFYLFLYFFKKLPAKIHSRITKCLLMNCSFIPTLELPGHFAHGRGSARKMTLKNDTDWSEAVPVQAPAWPPLPSSLSPPSLGVAAFCGVPGIILWNVVFSVTRSTSNVLGVDEVAASCCDCETWWLFFNLPSKPVHTQ